MKRLIWLGLLLPVVALATELKDPTRPPGARTGNPTSTTVALSRLQLQQVVSGGQKASALINGELVRVGDKVRGYQVVAIAPRMVTLRRAGKTYWLKMFDLEFATPAQQEVGN